jgi:hypothetical protein
MCKEDALLREDAVYSALGMSREGHQLRWCQVVGVVEDM